MPGVTRVGDKCTGHDGYEPKPLIEGSKTFKVDGRPVGLVGCHYEPHSKPDNGSHQDYIVEGAPSFFIEGKVVARIGDKVSNGGTVAEGSSTFIVGNKGGTDYGISLGFPVVESVLLSRPDLAPVDEIILATPAIAENEGLTDYVTKDDTQGWLELAQMLRFWLMGEPYILTSEDIKNGTAPIYMLRLEWDWFVGFSRFATSVNTLKLDALSDAGRKELVKSLKKIGIWDKGGDFDFSKFTPKEWEKYYFNHISVRAAGNIYADGLAACLGSHTIRVLASGNVEVLADGTRKITVSNLYMYVHDLFQFEGEYDLKWWSKQHLDFYSNPFDISDLDETYVNLTNDHFNTFRKKFNKGRDFLVLSSVKMVDDFHETVFHEM